MGGREKRRKMDFEEFSGLVYRYTFLNHHGQWVFRVWWFAIKPGISPGKKIQIVLHSKFHVATSTFTSKQIVQET